MGKRNKGTLRAIVVGASSGIGEGLARALSQQGYIVGLAARRLDRLRKIQKELPHPSVVQELDLRQPEAALAAFDRLIGAIGGVDLVVVASGIGYFNPDLLWERELETLQVNVVGFTAIASRAVAYFKQQGKGHLVGISSIAGIKGNGQTPAYGASKAFETRYLQALRHQVGREGLPIAVTEIQPGFVDTDMVKRVKTVFMVPLDKAVKQMMRAIQRRRSHVYISRRWRFIAWFLRLIPDWVYCRPAKGVKKRRRASGR